MIRRAALLFFVFVLVSLSAIQSAFAGAWTVPKYKVWGEYYIKWLYAKDTFEETCDRQSASDHGKKFRNQELVMEPKLEYGITDWLNFQCSIEYKQSVYKEYNRPASWGSYVRKNNGLTNVKIGGKWRLLEKPFVVSTQTRVFIYPGYGVNHGDDGGADLHKPGIGYGDDAVEQRILVGKQFNVPFGPDFKLPCYFGAETGYRWRTKHVCNDIPYFLEGGFWPYNWLLLKSELDGYKVHGGTGSIKSGYGIWRVGGVWQVFGDSTLREGDKMFNIEFQYGMTVWGKNSNDSQEWVMKIQTQF